jgi:polar amino acid transport system substrate-binding protein
MRVTRLLVMTSTVVALSACASPRNETETARQALAPSGELRIAFLSGPLYATKDAGSGEHKGVAVDLGRNLASRLGVPMRPVVYENPAAIIAASKAREWDVAMLGASAERAAAVDFSAPYMEVEQGYLVRSGIPVTSMAEVDKTGLRIGVIERGGADVLLSKTLKNATLVRAKGTADLAGLLSSEKADVIAATKAFLYGQLKSHPGARLLDGRISVEPIAMAVPKGRAPAAALALDEFVEDAKRTGFVASAIERAGLRGVATAPPK